jgi:hypothetical protein
MLAIGGFRVEFSAGMHRDFRQTNEGLCFRDAVPGE